MILLSIVIMYLYILLHSGEFLSILGTFICCIEASSFDIIPYCLVSCVLFPKIVAHSKVQKPFPVFSASVVF